MGMEVEFVIADLLERAYPDDERLPDDMQKALERIAGDVPIGIWAEAEENESLFSAVFNKWFASRTEDNKIGYPLGSVYVYTRNNKAKLRALYREPLANTPKQRSGLPDAYRRVEPQKSGDPKLMVLAGVTQQENFDVGLLPYMGAVIDDQFVPASDEIKTSLKK